MGGREMIGEGLRPLPVVNAQEGVVGEGEADPRGGELAAQPAMPVTIELKAKRTPSWHGQIDQAQLGVDEVEVVMQAFAAVQPQKGVMCALVVPGPIAGAGFHRRNDMHLAGMVAAGASTLATMSSLRMWFLAMCSMVTPAALANSAARLRTRSRSGSANRG
jgi:hypothetical protein